MLAYQNGEERAFETLFKRHSPRLWAYLRRREENSEQAAELFQSVFLKLHRCRRSYDPAFPFLPWLFTICRNTLIDEARQRATRAIATDPRLLDELPGQSCGQESESGAEVMAGRELPSLFELPEAQREALQLRYGEDWSFEEIARRLDTSSMNARQIVSRGIRRLRKLAARAKAPGGQTK
jgi:RNA polymerase sigma-70 factor (ECF subfamily)